jgi:hypothetical protein
MLMKWLTTRPSRLAKKDHSFRPWLESLEERNAPSGPGGPPGPGPNGPPPPPPGPPGPPPPHPAPPHHPPGIPLGVNNSISAAAGNGNHGSFNNSTITGSFNTTVNNTTVSVNLTMGQTAGVGQLLGISNFLSSALSNPQLGSLLNDEIALAVDHYLTSTPAIASVLGTTVVSDLTNDAATLTAAIAANPLEASPIGALIGTVAYDLTSSALMGAQPTI